MGNNESKTMTQPELQQKMAAARDRLKLATHYADSYINSPITPECATTLEQVTMKAMAAVTALRSAASGNDDPKTTVG